jgi:microcystin degradation protein MlrC
MPRVGILALLQESNTFLREQTTLEHFQRELLLTGEAVRTYFQDKPHEVGGFFAGLARAGLEAIPLFAARALPFGTVTAEAWSALMAQMDAAFEAAGALDGVLVAPHGATVAEPAPDADGFWLGMVRRRVGPDVPVIGTLDPHANLSPAMVAATDALCAYRTNPHVDQRARGEEAAELLARTLRGEIRPRQSACFPPMLINIERQCTAEPPLADLCRRFDEVRRRPHVLSASLLLGFPYADVTEMGSAALVVTDGEARLAEELARELGSALWSARHELAGEFLSIEEAVTQAARLPGPVCLLDMGDNVGGGSPGDGTWLAWECHRRRIGPTLVVIHDPQAAQAAIAAGVGRRLVLQVGGRSDDRHGPPLTAEFEVRHVCDGKFTETEVRHGGFTECDQGPTAIVTADSGLSVMLTSRRMPPFSLQQLTGCGVDPRAYQILVTKGVNAPLAAYRPVCPHLLRVNTPGVTTADVRQLPFARRRRPMFPFEPDTAWHASS